MTIPGTSLLAFQDQLTENKASFKVHTVENVMNISLQEATKFLKPQAAKNQKTTQKTYDLSDFDYSDVEDFDNSVKSVLDPSIHTDLKIRGDEEASESSDEETIDENGMINVKIRKIRNPIEISLHDARVSRRQQLMAEEQKKLGIESPNTSFSKSASGVTSPNSSFSMQPNTVDLTNTSSNSITLNTSLFRNAGMNTSVLNNQVLSLDSCDLGPGKSNLPDKIVPVCVKYPLMGVADEWKDSFQTISEETDLYKNIETWRCPYLLRFYGTHGPGVVFEYVDGSALDEALAAENAEIIRQDWKWSELGEHIATALLYLHKRKISHNDLKPENIRFSETKNMWKLLDLGLSTNIEAKVCRKIGTDGYRAPEVEQTGLLSFKSDVYGFGVMMEDTMLGICRRYNTLEQFYIQNKHLMGVTVGPVKTDVEELEDTILLGGQTWIEFKELMEILVKRCKDKNPTVRPSVTRLVNFFLAIQSKEEEVAEAHRKLLQNYMK